MSQTDIVSQKTQRRPLLPPLGSVGEIPGQEEAAQFDPAQAAGRHSRGLGQ